MHKPPWQCHTKSLFDAQYGQSAEGIERSLASLDKLVTTWPSITMAGQQEQEQEDQDQQEEAEGAAGACNSHTNQSL